MSRRLLLAAFVLVLSLTGTAGAHLLDHAPPTGSAPVNSSTAFSSGGQDAQWELVTSILTGNPHTDLDFFSSGGESYASVGTLAAAGNRGGQSIVKLTKNGRVAPSYVTGHPSATCVSNPEAALGLQHDVEASPKGGTLLGDANPAADRREAQIIVDATEQQAAATTRAWAASSWPRRAASRSSTSPIPRSPWRSASPATSAKPTRSTSTRSARISPTP